MRFSPVMSEKDATHVSFQACLPLAARFAAYTFMVAGLSIMLPTVVKRQGVSFFYENGAIEWCQFFLLAVSSLLFAAGAWRLTSSRQLLALLASVSAFAATRELDRVLGKLIPVVSWKIGGLFLVGATWLVVRRWRSLLPQVAVFLRTPAFAMLWAGFLVAVPLAQLVGHAPFFRLFMDEIHVRDIKRVFEESGEFMGYLILLFGAIETLLSSVGQTGQSARCDRWE
jgi:hypothetical protein